MVGTPALEPLPVLPLPPMRPWSAWACIAFSTFTTFILIATLVSGYMNEDFMARVPKSEGEEIWHSRAAMLLIISAAGSELCLLASSWTVRTEVTAEASEVQSHGVGDSAYTITQYLIKAVTAMYMYQFEGGIVHLDSKAPGGPRMVYLARHVQWALGVPLFMLVGNRSWMNNYSTKVLYDRCAPALSSSITFVMAAWAHQVTLNNYLRSILFWLSCLGPVLVNMDQFVLALHRREDRNFGLKFGIVVYQAAVMAVYGMFYCLARFGVLSQWGEQLFYAYADSSICILQGALLSVIRHCESVDNLKHWFLSALAAKEDLDNLIRKACVPVFTLDLQGNILAWNESLEELTGWSYRDVAGQPLVDLATEESRPSLAEVLAHAVEQGKAGKGESRFTELFIPVKGRAPGQSKVSVRHLCMSLVALSSQDGKVTGIMAIGQDLSDLNELKSMQQKKSALMAMMSHEIRSPLHGILGLTETMLTRKLFRGNRQLGMVKGCAGRLLDLVQNVMELAQQEKQRSAGLKPASFRDPVDFVLIANEVTTMSKMAVDKANRSLVKPNVMLINELMGVRLPLVAGCPHKCTQLLYNLVTNACKFTEEGSVTISSEYNKEAKMLEVCVTDTGKGIAPENQKRIFQPFEQEKELSDNSSDRNFQGIGLGLAVCVEICNLFGGKLDLQSQLGQGSTFVIKLPCDESLGYGECLTEDDTIAAMDYHESSDASDNDEQDDEGSVMMISKPSRRRSSFSHRPLVLCVDDDATNQEVVRTALADFCDVRCELDGFAAMAYLDSIRASRGKMPDALLVDYYMPGMNGVELVNNMKANFGDAVKKIQLVLVSSIRTDKFMQLEMAEHKLEFVQKPFRSDALRTKMATLLCLQEAPIPPKPKTEEMLAQAEAEAAKLRMANGDLQQQLMKYAEEVREAEKARQELSELKSKLEAQAAQAQEVEKQKKENEELRKKLQEQEEQAKELRKKAEEAQEQAKREAAEKEKEKERKLEASDKRPSAAESAEKAAEVARQRKEIAELRKKLQAFEGQARREARQGPRPSTPRSVVDPQRLGQDKGSPGEAGSAVFAFMASRLDMVNQVAKGCQLLLDLAQNGSGQGNCKGDGDLISTLSAHQQVAQVVRSQLQILEYATDASDFPPDAAEGLLSCTDSKRTPTPSGRRTPPIVAPAC